jgi:hypothetical protein
MNFRSIVNDICCDSRIKDGVLRLENPDHVFIVQEYLEKAGYALNEIVDKTANLFEAGRFPDRQAYNKDGILVTFPSKEYRDRAVNKGTHFAENPKKAQANIFSAPGDLSSVGATEEKPKEKPDTISVDKEVQKGVEADDRVDNRTPKEKQQDAVANIAILQGQTPLVNYSVDEAMKYGFYRKGMLWFNTEGQLIGEQVFDEERGSIISINESLISSIFDFMKKSWNKVKSYFKNVVSGLIDNGMSDLQIGQETDIIIPASIAKEKSGIESSTDLQKEGAIEAIRGNYNEALTVKYVIEKNDSPIDVVLTEHIDENYVIKVVQLDAEGKRYIPELESIVNDWDKKLRVAAGSKYEEVKAVISLASHDMSSYIINAVGKNKGNILEIFLDNKSFLQGAEFKADIRLRVKKVSGEEILKAYSLKMYQTKNVNLANSTKTSLVRNLCGDNEADKFTKELSSDPKFKQLDKVAKETNLAVKHAKADGEDEDYINDLRADREEARYPLNQYLAEKVSNKLNSFYKSTPQNKETFIKNLLRLMGYEDTETEFLMALVGPKQVKAGKSQIIDKHPALDFSDIDIVNDPGKVSIKIINKKTNKVLINFVAKEGGTFAGFVDVLS